MSHRLKEELMLCLFGEGDDFGLYRWAVARTNTLNLTVVERRVGQSFAEYPAGFGIRIYRIALALTEGSCDAGEVAEQMIGGIARLRDSLGEVDRTTVDTRRGACLHACGGKTDAAELLGETTRGRLGDASAFYLTASDVHETVEEGAVGEDDLACAEACALISDDAAELAVLVEGEGHYTTLPHAQVVGILEHRSP